MTNVLITLFERDLLGRVTVRTNPLELTKTYVYDRRDNVTAITDESGHAFALAYDDLSRLTSIAAPDTLLEASYDAAGNLTLASDTESDSVVTFGYDDVGRRIAETSSISGEAPITISSAWDLAGNRTSIADSFGASSAMTYDGAGRLQSLLSAAGTVVMDHDPSGRMGGILFPSDASAVYDYDPMGRLHSISHKDGSAAVLAAYTMGYDAVGSITTITDAIPERIRDFGYDALRRLVSETIRPSEMAEPTETNSYTYTPSGNRRTSPFSQTHQMEVPNRLVSDDEFSYEYDDNGNLVSKTSEATSEQTVYHWDSRNQLTGIDVPGGAHAEYRYDALGRRIEKSVDGQTTRYVYDAEDIVLETDETGTLLRRYRHGDGIDQPLVLEDAATGDSYFYHADHLGSVRLVTDEAGTVVSEYEYDPYGQRTVVAEGIEQPYAFTGREFDAESGLYYYRARYYDARQGRFLGEDPIGLAGGDANLYGYTRGNPTNWIDPNGEYIWIAAGAAIGGALNVGATYLANGGNVTGSQLLASLLSGAASGALGAAAGPLGGSLALEVGAASNGAAAAVAAGVLSAGAGAAGQWVANTIDPCHAASLADAALWSGIGGGAAKSLFPTKNLNSWSQARNFGPRSLDGLMASQNARLNLASFFTSSGVAGAANFPVLSLFQ